MHPWHHFVAIGDSFSEGVGDPVDGYARLGPMDRIAGALRRLAPDLRYTNLAKGGLLLGEIRERQLDAAVALKPDLVSIVAGANDILKGRFDEARWEQEFRAMFASLTDAGATVFVGNLPVFPFLKTLREPLQVRIQRNISKGNAVIQRLADEYGAVFVDASAIPAHHAEEYWSADGVHLNARGYFTYAGQAVKTIEQHYDVEIGQVDPP